MKPWPLSALLKADRNAATVFCVLRLLAGGKPSVKTTRASITEHCHLYKDTVTHAMKALHEAGWIDLSYGHTKPYSWYQVSFHKANSSFLPEAVKTRSSKSKSNGKNPPQIELSGAVKTRLSLFREKGASPRPLRGESIAQDEHIADKRERELMEQAKAKREALETVNHNA